MSKRKIGQLAVTNELATYFNTVVGVINPLQLVNEGFNEPGVQTSETYKQIASYFNQLYQASENGGIKTGYRSLSDLFNEAAKNESFPLQQVMEYYNKSDDIPTNMKLTPENIKETALKLPELLNNEQVLSSSIDALSAASRIVGGEGFNLGEIVQERKDEGIEESSRSISDFVRNADQVEEHKDPFEESQTQPVGKEIAESTSATGQEEEDDVSMLDDEGAGSDESTFSTEEGGGGSVVVPSQPTREMVQDKVTAAVAKQKIQDRDLQLKEAENKVELSVLKGQLDQSREKNFMEKIARESESHQHIITNMQEKLKKQEEENIRLKAEMTTQEKITNAELKAQLAQKNKELDEKDKFLKRESDPLKSLFSDAIAQLTAQVGVLANRQEDIKSSNTSEKIEFVKELEQVSNKLKNDFSDLQKTVEGNMRDVDQEAINQLKEKINALDQRDRTIQFDINNQQSAEREALKGELLEQMSDLKTSVKEQNREFISSAQENQSREITKIQDKLQKLLEEEKERTTAERNKSLVLQAGQGSREREEMRDREVKREIEKLQNQLQMAVQRPQQELGYPSRYGGPGLSRKEIDGNIFTRKSRMEDTSSRLTTKKKEKKKIKARPNKLLGKSSKSKKDK